MRRVTLSAAIVFVAMLMTSREASAQASITGAVRDGSGAVLPGVSVEASSPALIEKTRTVVTDAAGQYRIVDLRPGTYAVAFTLPGFKTVRRANVVLEGAFAAQINAALEVGAIEETVTVTGATPTVDVTNNTTQFVANRDILDSIPTPMRNTPARALLLPHDADEDPSCDPMRERLHWELELREVRDHFPVSRSFEVVVRD